MTPKVIGMVLSADLGRYPHMIQQIRKSWGSYSRDGFDMRYYYGDGLGIKPARGTVWPHGDNLICGCSEHVDNIMLKTVMAFDYIHRNLTFDYIIRTCCGAYVAPWRLIKYLEDKPRTGFYMGRKAQLSPDDAVWAHGIGYVLSRDLVALIGSSIDEIGTLGLGRIDDVIVGRFLAAKGVSLVAMDPPPTDYPATIPPKGFLHHFNKNFGKMPDVHAELMKLDGITT